MARRRDENVTQTLPPDTDDPVWVVKDAKAEKLALSEALWGVGARSSSRLPRAGQGPGAPGDGPDCTHFSPPGINSTRMKNITPVCRV